MDRAKTKLTREIVKIIKDEATRREDNLPVDWHFSKARLQAILDRVNEAHAQTGRQVGPAGTGNAGAAVSQAGNRATAQDVAGREGQGAGGLRSLPRPQERLKPFSPPKNVYKFAVLKISGELHVLGKVKYYFTLTGMLLARTVSKELLVGYDDNAVARGHLSALGTSDNLANQIFSRLQVESRFNRQPRAAPFFKRAIK